MTDELDRLRPERIARLRRPRGAWPSTTCARCAATIPPRPTPLAVVAAARLHLETAWLPLLERIRTSTAMTAPFGGPALLVAASAAARRTGRADDRRRQPGHPGGRLRRAVPDPGVARCRRDAIQYFIDDDDVCLSGTGPTWPAGTATIGRRRRRGDHGLQPPGQGAHRARPRARDRYGRRLCDARRGRRGRRAADRDDRRRPVELPDDHPSQFRRWTEGEGIDGNIVFDYRFELGDAEPRRRHRAGHQRGHPDPARPDGTVRIDGRLAQYPTSRSSATGSCRTATAPRSSSSGAGVRRPLNLFEAGERFDVAG